MMAGNPNWWSMMNGMHPQPNSQFVYGSSNSPLPSNPSPQDQQDFPVRSWSQLLLGGLGHGGEEERYGASLFQQQQQKKLDINWEEHQEANLNPSSFTRINHVDDVKQEVSQPTPSSQLYVHQLDPFQDHEFHPHNMIRSSNSWTHHNQVLPVSSPTSCVTTLSNNNFLNFSSAKPTATVDVNKNSHERHEDHVSEGNSRSTGGVSKKARVQQSSAKPDLKVRKEKLGDRITALHQLVSPFGKTDTASVLSEAIGYIRFLQAQIEALSTPYMRNGSGGNQQHCVQERNCLFPEELNQDTQLGRGTKDLKSRGLCLVPISCTQHVGNETGADYWAASAALDGGGF